MNIKHFFTLTALIFFIQAHAQIDETEPGQSQLREARQFEQLSNFDIGLRRGGILMQLDYQHIHRLNPENRFRMGYGLALTRFRGFNDIPYTIVGEPSNADAGVGLDTFQVENAKISSLNLFLLVNYAPNNRIDFGLLVDAIGLSWGDVQKGLFASGPNDPNPRGGNAAPVQLNTSFGSLGSWRSRFQLRYWVYPRWSLQTAATFWRSAYQISEDTNLGNGGSKYSSGLWFWQMGLAFRWGEVYY
ncbi:hypothetical protein OKW21_000566 [Catalinimonas alkaloidigena]|uniref:hypothetical protein n=1 Tax=Catalinimonas alkaloidigena TaxID=1075417 RepID=UPI002406F4A0|nr:hypothetical protein [Catalinimonas alkaloidigena]MDF9795303.1 hypothetical protein [Catalinimonas alkaloidigena]